LETLFWPNFLQHGNISEEELPRLSFFDLFWSKFTGSKNISHVSQLEDDYIVSQSNGESEHASQSENGDEDPGQSDNEAEHHSQLDNEEDNSDQTDIKTDHRSQSENGEK
jgi:hypothetical protein